jgi:hypothetical protein
MADKRTVKRKGIMGHNDRITKLLMNVTEPVIVIDILNNM